MITRRQFMQRTAMVGSAAAVTAAATATLLSHPLRGEETYKGDGLAPGQPDTDYLPVEVPNGAKLPWKIVDGAKVFHLVAQEVDHDFAPGLKGKCWGYNGMIHGPTIEAVEGDRVRIYVTNQLPEPTTVHWHGILLPNGMDGVGGLTTSTSSSRTKLSSTSSSCASMVPTCTIRITTR